MNQSKVDIPKKKRGRKPTTGRGEGVLVRLHQPVIEALDDAARAEGVGRAELIRRIVWDRLTAHGYLPRPAEAGSIAIEDLNASND